MAKKSKRLKLLNGGENEQNVDLLKAGRMIRVEFPLLDDLHEQFSRGASITLTKILNSRVKVNLVSDEVYKYSDVIEKLEKFTSTAIVSFHELSSKQGLIFFSPPLSELIVEKSMGSSGSVHTILKGRELSNVEAGLMEGVAQRLSDELAASWRPVMKILIDVRGLVVNPAFIRGFYPDQIMCTYEYEVVTNHGTGKFIVAYPYSSLAPHEDKFIHKQDEDEIEDVSAKSVSAEPEKLNEDEKVAELVSDIPLEMSIIAGKTRMKISDILKLKEGDIINLDTPRGEPLDVVIGGVTKMRVHAVNNEVTMVRVVEKVENE